MQVVIKTVCLEIPAMHHVLATVKPTRVKYRMDHVLSVSMDGQELHVTQVYIKILLLILMRFISTFFNPGNLIIFEANSRYQKTITVISKASKILIKLYPKDFY